MLDALADDFNTPRALAALFELVAEGNRRQLPGARAALEEMLELLGLESLLRPPEEIEPEAERLMEERERARAERDFERADRVRDELTSLGYEVRDTPDGPRLVRRAG
jgi:cysteinyl-tRNA synthetase